MIVALLISAAACSAAVGGMPSEPGQEPTAEVRSWDRGTWELGLLGGYARGKVYDAERTPVGFVQAMARAAFHFGPTGDGIWRGNWSIVAEGLGTWVDQDPHSSAAGFNLLARYSWATRERWRPFAAVGAGILYSQAPIPAEETRRNYTPQLGGGLQYLTDPDLAFTIEYRYHHISNKGATDTNPGINSHLVLFGFSFFH